MEIMQLAELRVLLIVVLQNHGNDGDFQEINWFTIFLLHLHSRIVDAV